MSRSVRLGAFIIATLAILIAGIFVIGGKQYLFTSTYELKAQFNDVVGLGLQNQPVHRMPLSRGQLADVVRGQRERVAVPLRSQRLAVGTELAANPIRVGNQER